MFTINVFVAGQYFKLNCLYKSTIDYFKGYQTESSSTAFEITSSDDKMKFILDHSESQPEINSELEPVSIMYEISKFLVSEGTILIHGSAVEINGKTCIFTAESGTGKSTHRRMLQNLLGNAVTVINDDKPFIGISSSGNFVYGSPCSGKECLNTNKKSPLCAVVLLERGEKNSIEEVSADEGVFGILRRIQFFRSRELDSKLMDLIAELCNSTRFFRLKCRPDTEAAELSYNTLYKEL